MELRGRKYSLPSGAELTLIPATYVESEDLLGAVLASVGGLPAKFDEEEYTNLFSNLVVANFFTKPEIKNAIWGCLGYCLYKGAGKTVPEKVTRALFDNGHGKREDVPEIFFECAKENLLPFMSGLWKASKTLQAQINATQTQTEGPKETRS